MSDPDDDQDNETRLLTSIDGEEARLLVHIEPIDPADDDATEATQSEERTPPNSSRLAQ